MIFNTVAIEEKKTATFAISAKLLFNSIWPTNVDATRGTSFSCYHLMGAFPDINDFRLVPWAFGKFLDGAV